MKEEGGEAASSSTVALPENSPSIAELDELNLDDAAEMLTTLDSGAPVDVHHMMGYAEEHGMTLNEPFEQEEARSMREKAAAGTLARDPVVPPARKSARKMKGKRRSSLKGEGKASPNTKKTPSSLKRRRSSTSSTNRQQQQQQNRLACLDAQPDRLVQPLIQAPVINRVQTAADFVAMSDLWHPLPDTYPLSYLARLLGFAVPATATTKTTTTTTTTTASFATTTIENVVSFGPKTVPLMRDDSYLNIPPLGSFASTVWRAPPRHSHTSVDFADQQTLDILDPLYESLLHAGQGGGSDKSTTENDGEDDYLLEIIKPVTKTHITRLWELLVDACNCHDKSKHDSDRSLWSKTLGELKKIAGVSFGVHAYRPYRQNSDNTNNNNEEPSPWQLPANLDLSGLDIDGQVTFDSADMGLILSLNGKACGALFFRYEWYVSAARTSLVVRWKHLILPIPLEENAELVAVVLIALSMEHARAAQAYYGTYDYPYRTKLPFLNLFEECFRATRLSVPFEETSTGQDGVVEEEDRKPSAKLSGKTEDASRKSQSERIEEEKGVNDQTKPESPKYPADKGSGREPEKESQTVSGRRVRLLADFNKSNSRYALLTWKRLTRQRVVGAPKSMNKSADTSGAAMPTRYRTLLRLPNVDEAKSLMEGRQLKRKRLPGGTSAMSIFANAAPAQRNVSLQMQANITDAESVEIFVQRGDDKILVEVPEFVEEPVGWQVLKTFQLIDNPAHSSVDEEEEDLFRELKEKQAQLAELESGMEPHLRNVMERVVQERLQYEKRNVPAMKQLERSVMEENKKMLDRRRAVDLEMQKRLEEDMDAVCCICDDGEVTPDNQIIFCESCDVPVHQLCYGVEKIPSEDYYCQTCRYLGRDKEVQYCSTKKGKSLPVVCALCPHKGGAFFRSDVPKAPNDPDEIGKWVHVVCAKWQGLLFVNPKKHDLIEDFTELKNSFRQLEIHCSLCRSTRGCMNKCREDGCDSWCHVLCARRSGICEVTHGENCHGEVSEHPWTLLCPAHTNINPDDVPKSSINVPELIEMAKEFPPEPTPEARPVLPMPFNSANGKERKELLGDAKYEQALIYELLFKRHVGIRCEICDNLTESSKDIIRCTVCTASFCYGCRVTSDNFEGTYKCPSCVFVESSKGTDAEVETPHCIACFQKDGPLRPAMATPVKKSSWTSKKKKDFQRSIYGKKFWVHTMCAFWHKGLFFSKSNPGGVDFRDVVTPHSKHGFVYDKHPCQVCGQKGGLKSVCSHPGCVMERDGETIGLYFHPTCARQAGLEATENEQKCYLKCYRHGGNEYNLRAHLEDLIEIEKRRAGKNFARADNPMKFSDACRLLHASIRVMRVLGWAWRWAEWWVDYGSSWEPLLEPGEKEEEMTKEQLKIVDSTRESRASDARLCRLAAFGAALRNRAYDKEDGFDQDALNRALRAVLQTKSLVGPLEKYEMNFLADWLARAYKTESRLLGLGDNKIEVAREGFCLHIEDNSPKFELENRPVPGKQKTGFRQKYETGIKEPDDFLKTALLEDTIVPTKPPAVGKRPRGRPPSNLIDNQTPLSVPKRRGRPRRSSPADRSEKKRKRRKTSNTKPSDSVAQTFAVYRKSDGRFARRTDNEALTIEEIRRPNAPSNVEVELTRRKIKKSRKPKQGDRERQSMSALESESDPEVMPTRRSTPSDVRKKGPGRPRRREGSDSTSDMQRRRGPGRPRKNDTSDSGSKVDSVPGRTRRGATGISSGNERPRRAASKRAASAADLGSSDSNDDDDHSDVERTRRTPRTSSKRQESLLRLADADSEADGIEDAERSRKRGRPTKKRTRLIEEEHDSKETGKTDDADLMDWRIPSKKDLMEDETVTIDAKRRYQKDVAAEAASESHPLGSSRRNRTQPERKVRSPPNNEHDRIQRRTDKQSAVRDRGASGDSDSTEASPVVRRRRRYKRGKDGESDGNSSARDESMASDSNDEDDLPIDDFVALARAGTRRKATKREPDSAKATVDRCDAGNNEAESGNDKADTKVNDTDEDDSTDAAKRAKERLRSTRKLGRAEGKEEAIRLLR